MPLQHANGIDVHYETEGAGPPLVMLHGATSSLEDWAAQRPLLRRSFQLYLPDARSHARTRWDVDDGWTSEMLVEDLRAFVDALGIERFHLAGFSMGAMTALRFATESPERLETLLIAGIDTEREPRAAVSRRLMDPARVEQHEPAWAEQLERRHGAVQGERAWHRLLPAIAADVAEQPLLTSSALARVRVPTLYAVGDRDVFVPLTHAVGLFRQLPDARMFVAPDCDHQVMVSRAGLFNEAAATFYRSTEAAARARSEGRAASDRSTLRGPNRAPVPTSLGGDD